MARVLSMQPQDTAFMRRQPRISLYIKLSVDRQRVVRPEVSVEIDLKNGIGRSSLAP